MAGGFAKRLYPLTKDKSKCLLEIAGKPIIDYTIDKLREIQRSNEEKESGGIESGIAGITLSSNESEIRKTIITLKKNIEGLLNEIHELEDEARKLENQSKIMEQRASQIESKGK